MLFWKGFPAFQESLLWLTKTSLQSNAAGCFHESLYVYSLPDSTALTLPFGSMLSGQKAFFC